MKYGVNKFHYIFTDCERQTFNEVFGYCGQPFSHRVSVEYSSFGYLPEALDGTFVNITSIHSYMTAIIMHKGDTFFKKVP